MARRDPRRGLDPGVYAAVTFDCYGTLIDWESGILSALRPLLHAHASSPTDAEILELYGRFEVQAEAGPYRRYREVLRSVVDRFGEHCGFVPTSAERLTLEQSMAYWEPFPDTVPALSALARRYRLAVISNVDDDLFADSAARLRVPFASVITARQVRAYKPDPALFHHAIARLAVPKERVLHVAQSLHHDVAPARQLGITTVWVNRRHGRPGSGATPPSTASADHVVPDLATLAAQLTT
jgi:2-haloacid dehalogenase